MAGDPTSVDVKDAGLMQTMRRLPSLLSGLFADLRDKSRFRVRTVRAGLVSPRRTHNGHTVLSFCTNDYLGLAGDARVIAACQRGLDEYGVGAGSAFLIDGYTNAHRQLEEELAQFTGRDRALLFPSGYMANLGMIGSMLGRHVVGQAIAFSDKLNHASLLDGVLLSGATLRRYKHLDMAHLDELLCAQSGNESENEVAVISESVFSMDGSQAPLPTLAELCERHQCLLMIDEAHSFGVCGDGAGLCAEMCADLDEPQMQVPLMMATLGKACGTAGAFVAGDDAMVEAVLQFARTYKYTTAMPPAIACATSRSLALIKSESWRRDKLFANVACFKEEAREHGVPCLDSDMPIQGVIAGDDERAVRWSDNLRRKGFDVVAIRPPTVPEGSARLRVTLSAAHESDDIKAFVRALAECCH